MTTWLDGRTVAPIAIAAWLEALVKAHRAVPPPSLSKPESATDIRPIKLKEVGVATRTINRPGQEGIIVQSVYPRRATNATGVLSALTLQQRKGVSDHATQPL